MNVSLKQVASRAGVSMSTVSRVLSGDERAQIARETQETVRRAAEELGYRPNHFARSLITGRTQTIGLMISRLDNPFFVTLMEHAEEMAKAAGYNVLIDADGSVAEEYAVSGRLINWPVDGVLMWTWSDRHLADYIGQRAERTPVVYICEQPRTDGNGCISYDLLGGAEMLARHALSKGYSSPAHLVPYAPGDWVRPDARAQVYADCCDAAGVTLRTITLTQREETREAGFLTGLELASLPELLRPDLLFCHNDIVAVGLYHGLLRGGLRVPEDVALVGFDGIDEGKYLNRRLTTVEIPIAEIGRQAAHMLLAELNGQPGPRSVIVPPSLVPGETV